MMATTHIISPITLKKWKWEVCSMVHPAVWRFAVHPTVVRLLSAEFAFLPSEKHNIFAKIVIESDKKAVHAKIPTNRCHNLTVTIKNGHK